MSWFGLMLDLDFDLKSVKRKHMQLLFKLMINLIANYCQVIVKM